jgi:hypothetical protein
MKKQQVMTLTQVMSDVLYWYTLITIHAYISITLQKHMRIYKSILLPLFLMGILMVSPFIGISPLVTTARENSSSVSESNSTNSNSSGISVNSSVSDIEKRMVDISTSDNPEDMATLAYVWGYPLVTMQRSFDYFTSPDTMTKGVLGSGPANHINFARELANASFKDVVSPGVDLLYGPTWLNLTKEPVVLKVPAIEPDRYYTFEFLDAYTNVYTYVGTRATGSDGGTYLIAGPDWKGTVPDGMTKIWAPTNLNWIHHRMLAKGPSDTSNANAIQDQIKVMPLSDYLGNSTSSGTATKSNASSSTDVQINPAPQFIPTTGIKIYDEIGAAMAGNPLNPPDPDLVKKIASIGIGPGKTPSTQANDTIKTALQTGITEGEKLIAAQVANSGSTVNGWDINADAGVYGTDYLFRAAVTKFAFGANIAQEALYPVTFVDSEGKPLTGANNYTIHFEPGQAPPVNAFWSITMYDNLSLLVDNPINRYNIGQYTEGLKNNTDGSLDIFVQHDNPGPDRESNWLPAPSPQESSNFNLILRTFLPGEPILNGTWNPPPVQRTLG